MGFPVPVGVVEAFNLDGQCDIGGIASGVVKRVRSIVDGARGWERVSAHWTTCSRTRTVG